MFREQGVTIASIITALGFIVSTLVLAVTGGTAGVVTQPKPLAPPETKDGAKEWAKKHLKALGRMLASLAAKAAAARKKPLGARVCRRWPIVCNCAGVASGASIVERAKSDTTNDKCGASVVVN